MTTAAVVPDVPTEATTRATRIVILDENSTRAKRLAALLAECGVDVECVTTLRDADEAIARHHPDMIMLHLDPDAGHWEERAGRGVPARVRLALRKFEHVADPPRYEAAGLSIDLERRRVRAGANEVRLSPKEFELISYLADRANTVVPHHAILTAIWGRQAIHHPERLWALVTKVRRKIEPDPNEPRYLLSEPWVGYRLALQQCV
jgi:DNA-binding response OmpR family regulator